MLEKYFVNVDKFFLIQISPSGFRLPNNLDSFIQSFYVLLEIILKNVLSKSSEVSHTISSHD